VHVALPAGLALAQVGEFAFVLSRSGRELGLIDGNNYQLFLSASVITMLATPGLLYIGRELSQRMPQKAPEDLSEGDDKAPLEDHVVVAGYGVNGQNLTRALSATQIPYAILEMNPETVRSARARGEPIHFGDCTKVPVLEGLGIAKARMFVVAISDASSTRQAVSLARSLNATTYILVRTRFVAEVPELKQLGADEVIPEEFETSIEIFARVLSRYGVPRNMILDLVDRLRRGHYGVMRDQGHSPTQVELPWEVLSQLDVEMCALKGGGPAVGRSLAEINLRAETGVTVIGVRRNSEMTANPSPDYRFEAGDILILLGDRLQLDRAILTLDPTLDPAFAQAADQDPEHEHDPPSSDDELDGLRGRT
jgi:CPA2 family monovalent cation:H+ antiporter-2